MNEFQINPKIEIHTPSLTIVSFEVNSKEVSGLSVGVLVQDVHTAHDADHVVYLAHHQLADHLERLATQLREVPEAPTTPTA